MACVMTGGATVESEEDAQFLSALPELSALEEVRVGDEVKLPPCVPDHYLAVWREKGRDCPRPGLAMDPDNEAPLHLLQIGLADHTRHLFEGSLRDMVPRRHRATVRARVIAALLDPVVTGRLYPKREDEE